MRVLVGDVGGTYTRLAVFTAEATGLAREREQVYASGEFPGLGEIARRFLAGSAACELGAFGIAGPVAGGRSKVTNLPWVVDAAELAGELDLEGAWLLNDLEALAHGLAALSPNDFRVLQAGAPDATGNAALIAAGTGLGEAGLYWDGRRHLPWATEGGHADFAPRNPREIALFEHLARRFGRVSWERVVSGPGLVNVFRFLLAHRHEADPEWFLAAEQGGDPAAAIAEAARAERSPVAAEALGMFCEIYGAEAGNLALKVMASGGIYVGGSIARKLIEPLASGPFLEALCTKGRMQPLLEAMPVQVVLAEGVALLGAARYALEAAGR